ncbi:MAG: hypothetical protein ABGZ53_22820 [Fuerstiella sp.]
MPGNAVGKTVRCVCGTEFNITPQQKERAKASSSKLHTVGRYKLKSGLLGKSYSASYECPNKECGASLKSQQEEIGNDESCPHCGMAFRLSSSPLQKQLEADESKRQTQLKAEEDAVRKKEEQKQAEQENERLKNEQRSVDVEQSEIAQLYPVTRPSQVPCPFCGEQIAPVAVRCRYCNTDLRPHSQSASSTQVHVNVQRGSGATNSLGISSLVLGIVSLCTCFVPPIGMMCSGVGLFLGIAGLAVAMGRRGTGIGYAIAGIFLNGIWLIVLLFFAATLAAMFHVAKQAAKPPVQVVPAEQAEEPDGQGGQAEMPDGPNEPEAEPKPEGGNGKAAKAEQRSVFDLREAHVTEQFSVALVDISVDRPSFKDSFGGDDRQSDKSYLLCDFQVINVHDRKLLNIRGESMFGSHCTIEDDVENTIRGVNFGVLSNPIGVVKSTDDIEPGDFRTHLMVFVVPPPKTEYLILTLDLKSMLGGEGEMKIKVTADQIKGFATVE